MPAQVPAKKRRCAGCIDDASYKCDCQPCMDRFGGFILKNGGWRNPDASAKSFAIIFAAALGNHCRAGPCLHLKHNVAPDAVFHTYVTRHMTGTPKKVNLRSTKSLLFWQGQSPFFCKTDSLCFFADY